MLAAMRAHLAKVESDVIRRSILARYPHIMDATGPRPPVQRRLTDTVSISSRYKREEKEKISADAAPVEGASAKRPESVPGPLVVSDEVARILQRDFPAVDYQKQLDRARNWCVLRGQAIRNVLLFLRKWFANAAKQADHVAESGKKVSASVGDELSPATAVVRKRLTAHPVVARNGTTDPFRMPTEAELEENARRGMEVMARWQSKQRAAFA